MLGKVRRWFSMYRLLFLDAIFPILTVARKSLFTSIEKKITATPPTNKINKIDIKRNSIQGSGAMTLIGRNFLRNPLQ